MSFPKAAANERSPEAIRRAIQTLNSVSADAQATSEALDALDAWLGGTPDFTGLIVGYLAPSADGVAAVQVRKADKTTVVLDVDTTNGRLGVGTLVPGASVHVADASLAGVLIENTANDNNQAGIKLRKTKGAGKTYAAGQWVAEVEATFWNNAGTPAEKSSYVYCVVDDVTAGAEDTSWRTRILVAGSPVDVIACNAGFLGVRTNAPTSHLDVNGYVRFREKYTVTHSSDAGDQGQLLPNDTHLQYHNGTRWMRIAWDPATW